jgi:hypothetical protein
MTIQNHQISQRCKEQLEGLMIMFLLVLLRRQLWRHQGSLALGHGVLDRWPTSSGSTIKDEMYQRLFALVWLILASLMQA